MEKYIADRILGIQECFHNDPEHERLWQEQDVRNHHLLEILEQLTEEQRAAVEDYIGILIEIHLKTLIYAVS